MSVLLWSGRIGEHADHRNRAFIAYAGDVVDCEAVIHGSDVPRWRAALADAHGAADLRLRAATGRYQWHHVEVSVVAADARWVAIATADDAAASSFDDDLISRIAHDLVAPLTTMLLWEGVLRDPLDERMRAQALAAIRESALDQSRVVSELLDVSRALKGTLHLERRVVRLAALVDAAAADAHALARAHEVQLDHNTVPNADVMGDSARLRQVLDTLVAIAIRLGGPVTIALQRRREFVDVSISHARSDAAPPVGLAFVAAQRLVEMHGGTLSVTTNTFVVSLRARDAISTRDVSRDRAHRFHETNRHRTRARGRM